MASAPILLDSLPAEIIKRVASFSTCEAVLALLQTNRRLYKECNDHMVFKTVIGNKIGFETQQEWNIGFLSGNTSASECARFMLADSMIRQASAEFRSQSDGLGLEGNTLRDTPLNHINLWGLMRWMPQLVALHHPIITDPDISLRMFDTLLRRNMINWERKLDAIAGLNFCLTAKILHGDRQSKQHMRSHLLGSFEHAAEWPVTSLLACLLISVSPDETLLPTPTDVPFTTFTNFPLPFSSNPFSAPEESYLKTMTSKSFLEDGEWIGYYFYNTLSTATRMDPPMVGIHFTTSEYQPTGDADEIEAGDAAPDADGPRDDLEILQVEASGPEGIGHFTLTGQVWSSGRIDLTKIYAAGYTWQWNAWMTPYGIVGLLELDGSDRGYVWLWKRAWTNEASH